MGYVYILVNDSMPGLIKIGKTARNSLARAKDLSSSTGVPTPFKVAFELASEEHGKLEKEMHSRLSVYRVARNREFFKFQIDEAIRLLKELHSEIGSLSNPPRDWNLLSLRCRERVGWKCEECQIDLKFQSQRRYLHVHHLKGIQYNRPEDLRALCIGCHAEQPRHVRMKELPDYLKFMELYGETWKRLRKNKLNHS